MLRLLIIPLCLLLLLTGAVMWSGGGVQRPADFVFISRGEIGTLDTRGMSWQQDLRMAYALWEGLYALDPLTLQPIPGTADKVELSDDKTVYTFHIRPEARWSNGDPVQASDFRFAWKRAMEDPGDYTYLITSYVKGAKRYSEEFLAGKRPNFSDVGVEVLGPRMLRVRLEHPVTFFPDLCAFPTFHPLHEPSMRPFAEAPEPHTGRVRYRPDFIRPPHLVSNGPFRLESWEFKRRLRMVANEHYWDRKNVKSAVVDSVSSSDSQWAFLSYDSGAVDWLADLSAYQAAELKRAVRGDLRLFQGFGTYFYSINCRQTLPDGRRNPLADARVRRALAMAIDRQVIVQNVTRLGETPATTYIPPVFPMYRPPEGVGLNVPQARQLLAQAGYLGGEGFPKISIAYNNEFTHGDIAQVVRRQWAENLNIHVDLEGMEIKTFRNRLRDKIYSVGRASWIGDYNDVSTFTDRFLSYSDNNDSDWKNPHYDQLCAQAAREPDPAKRMELFRQAEQLLIDQMPIIPLHFYVNTYMFRDNIKGVPLHPLNMVMMKAVEVVRE